MENILFPQKHRTQYIVKYIYLAITVIEALETALTFRLESEIRNLKFISNEPQFFMQLNKFVPQTNQSLIQF